MTYVGVHLQLALPQCSLTGISMLNCCGQPYEER